MSKSPKLFRVAVLGASGGIGQPLSLLLKLNPLISHLSLYDIEKAGMPAKGVAADVTDIDTAAHVKGFAGDAELPNALANADIVVMAAGVPRKPGMTRDDLFKINAGIAKNLAEAIKLHAPSKCIIPIITNPVNSVVPIVNGVLQANRRVVGITTLDVVRASRILGERLGKDPRQVTVPVVGGHAGETIVPLFSQSVPSSASLSAAEIEKMDKMVQDAGTVVVEAKSGAGSATLSMAYAASRFVDSILRGLSGEKNVVECCYAVTGNGEYIAAPFTLCATGLGEMHNFEKLNLNAYERTRVAQAKKKLEGDVNVGNAFLKSKL